MSTPLYKMYEIGKEFINIYQSDMIWDGVVVGRHEKESKQEQKYLWIVRKAGTHLIYLPERTRFKGMFDFLRNENIGGTEMRFFFIENPTSDEGRFFEISAEAAEMVMNASQLEYPEPLEA